MRSDKIHLISMSHVRLVHLHQLPLKDPRPFTCIATTFSHNLQRALLNTQWSSFSWKLGESPENFQVKNLL